MRVGQAQGRGYRREILVVLRVGGVCWRIHDSVGHDRCSDCISTAMDEAASLVVNEEAERASSKP